MDEDERMLIRNENKHDSEQWHMTKGKKRRNRWRKRGRRSRKKREKV